MAITPKTSTLTRLTEQKTALDQEFLSKKSIAWMQEQIKELRTSPIKLAKEIVTEKGRPKGRFRIGGLYHYFYDPKTKDDLPYYDVFPLVILLRKDKDGFLGLNLHYLPPKLRAIFLDKLMKYAILNDDNEPERLRITYDILTATSRFKEYRPCIKQYLNSQIRSKIITVKPQEWETAIFLPTAVFRKAPIAKVYRESTQQARSKVN